MNKMRGSIFILCISLSCTCYSQSSIALGPEISVFSPKSYKNGFGGNVVYTSRVSNSFGGRASIGFIQFSEKQAEATKFRMLPIRLGFQWNENRFIGFAELGIAISKNDYSREETNFSIGAGLGYRIPLTEKRFLISSFNYNYLIKTKENYYTWLNFNLAYGFFL